MDAYPMPFDTTRAWQRVCNSQQLSPPTLPISVPGTMRSSPGSQGSKLGVRRPLVSIVTVRGPRVIEPKWCRNISVTIQERLISVCGNSRTTEHASFLLDDAK